MKKCIRFLALTVTIALLLCGCGTPLYEMTNEEEDLVVQASVYLLAKRNVYQKDGMNAVLPPKESESQKPEESQAGDDTQSGEESGNPLVPSGSNQADSSVAGGSISLAEAIGCGDTLEVSYEGHSLMDSYQEGTYFSLNANDGKTFVVLQFTIRNPGAEDVEIHNFASGRVFYGDFDSVSHVPEKASIIANSLASYEGTVSAGKAVSAVLIFEIAKEQAEGIGDPKITMRYEDTNYFINL